MCVFAGILYTVGGCVQSLVHPSRCQSSEPKHGEVAAGPGGDEEDEGGRHRDGQSPHQGWLQVLDGARGGGGHSLALICF